MITKKKQPQQTKYKKTNPNYMSFDTVDFNLFSRNRGEMEFQVNLKAQPYKGVGIWNYCNITYK